MPDLPASCQLCPRACGANRRAGEYGYCGADDKLRVARAALHFWEEPPISGQKGSGTVFFSNCPLRCVYCQNSSISLDGFGADISTERLVEIFLELQVKGAHNLNLVSATQYTPQVVEALAEARARGLRIPVIWNSSGYESESCIAELDGSVDAWLMDFRYTSSELAARYSAAPDYPEVARRAFAAIYRQSGKYRLDKNGILCGGIVARFLLLPGQLENSLRAVDEVFRICGDEACYALMSQYTPSVGIEKHFAELSARVDSDDYARLIEHTLDLGINFSFMQEDGSAEESFIPQFDLMGVLA